ncbi:unnamed protein product [Lepeophtheirus salmonis]|uniref:(salmon louse) hypothetical protein n=1 Tax=Lepeophtheirus salmonis TaxID=72036 RepID=A0A7R8H3B9_LEPSM|nr:unnamed protein product [Lepeophtheirus salmonis]CAF2828969.1 unnamed protein product [Lepeophtheirus salmonis]
MMTNIVGHEESPSVVTPGIRAAASGINPQREAELLTALARPQSKVKDKVKESEENPKYEQQGPITENEVKNCIPSVGAGKNPLGMDGSTFRSLNIPQYLLHSQEGGPGGDGDYRRITVLLHVTRTFQKVIANRLKQVSMSECQRGFGEVNGCSENFLILKTLLQLATKSNKKMRVAVIFIDYAKACDSVSHESLLKASANLGLPPLLLK